MLNAQCGRLFVCVSKTCLLWSTLVVKEISYTSHRCQDFNKKMEMKMNARYNVTIDQELLLSYELDKLTFENISNDTFEKSESSKRDAHRGNENFLFQGSKSADVTLSKDSQNFTSEASFIVKKLSTNIMNHEVHLDASKMCKDINGNKEPSASEGINNLLHRLYISDYDDEQDDSSEENESSETNKDSSLRERSPDHPKQLKNKRQSPYVRQKRDNPANLCLLDLYGDNSESNPFDIVDYFSKTSEGNEPNITASPELSTNHQLYDHVNTSGDNSIHKQNKEGNSDYGITDSCLEDCGASSIINPENDSETFFPLELNHYIRDVNDKAFLDFMDGLLSQLPDCDSTACSFSDNGERIPKCLEVTKNGDAKIAHIVKSNKIRKNELNLKTPDVSAAEIPIKSKPFGNTAKDNLKAFLCDDKYRAVMKKIFRNIQMNSKTKEDVKVIYIEDEGNKTPQNRTNLHNAVLNSELEEIYCLIEIHLKYSNQSLTELSLRDRYGKTALDYAIQNNMAPVVEYLREKKCCPNLHV